MQAETGTALSRRSLLAGALGAAVALGGCASPLRLPGTVRSPATVSTLLSDTPFFVAHRGGGGDWPEMTAYAYEQAAKIQSLKALEISVCRSADGVLVCSHDPTTTRVTGVDYTIAAETWATLSALKVRGRNTVDPQQEPRPLSRFDEIAETYASEFVLFVEPKVEAATVPLMAKLVDLGHPERMVWKQWLTSPHFREAKQNGFATWAYMLNEASHLRDLTKVAASSDVDLLGTPLTESDSFSTAVVQAADANDKKTIMWPIRTQEDQGRAVGLGCRGLMTSNIRELLA